MTSLCHDAHPNSHKGCAKVLLGRIKHYLSSVASCFVSAILPSCHKILPKTGLFLGLWPWVKRLLRSLYIIIYIKEAPSLPPFDGTTVRGSIL